MTILSSPAIAPTPFETVPAAGRPDYGTSLAPHSMAPDSTNPSAAKASGAAPERGELREVFDDFVGQTFYSQMLSAMRKTVDKPAYFHGGRAEEMFQAQLDQTLSERLADTTAEQFTGPMFELFNLSRR